VQARDHQRAEIRTVDPASGETTLVHTDTDPAWLQLTPGTPRWLPDGRLLRSAISEDTHRLFAGDEPCTPAALQVLSVVAVTSATDAQGASGRTVFTATTEATEQHLYAFDHATGEIEQLTTEPGLHSGVAAGRLLAVTSETLDADDVTVSVFDGGQPVASVACLAPRQVFAPQVTLVRAGERELRTAVLLPRDGHRPTGSLPILMAPYGGAAQRVLKARRLFYEPQWLADQGFAVVVADGRGTGGRGPAWDRAVAGDLATGPLEDQVTALQAAAEAFADLDTERVAIRGWSFGGFLSALAVLRRPDVFHAGVVGAPVTEWRLYDTFYTERYLGDPNTAGAAYDQSSITGDLERTEATVHRPLLIIHGLADDNVFVANSLRLSSALLAAGYPHSLLPLSGVTHMASQEVVAENLLTLQVDFLKQALGLPPTSA
jgi:dipeptidyl-peptidase 4